MALCNQLEKLETNPAATTIILQGATTELFSLGTDIERIGMLIQGKGIYEKADGQVRKLVLDYVREQYRLHHLIATYSKPIVTTMHGETRGSAWALAQHSNYNYASNNTRISLPEIHHHVTPIGGASYYLSRLSNGVGMWAALTGSEIKGVDAYWSGMASLYGSISDLRQLLPKEIGLVSANYNTSIDLHNDPIYQKAWKTLRDFRAENKLGYIQSNLSEDVSKEVFEEYVRLKRWYAYLVTGDKASAEIARSEDRFATEETGDLFDLNQGLEVHGGRGLGSGGSDHPGSYDRQPSFIAAERRARIGAVSAHAAAVFRGDEKDGLSKAPSPEMKRQLELIKKCFGGDAISGLNGTTTVKVSVTNTDSPSASSTSNATTLRLQHLAKLKSLGSTNIPGTWDTTLKMPIEKHIRESIAHLEFDRTDLENPVNISSSITIPSPSSSPSSPLQINSLESTNEVRGMTIAVREGVEMTWPTGQVSDQVVESILNRVFGAFPTIEGASSQALSAFKLHAEKRKLLLKVAVARVTASLHGLSPYSLTNDVWITTGRRLNRKLPLPGNGQPIIGPSGFTIPKVEETDVLEESGPHAPGGVFPMNPRLRTDPDGLYYDYRVDEDFWWPFTQGRWQGDVAFAGHADNLPIRPVNITSLVSAPVNYSDGAAISVSVLRNELLRLLNVSSRAGVDSIKSYINETAKYSDIAKNATKGDTSASASIMKLREETFGRDGLRVVSKRLNYLRKEEDGIEGSEEGGINNEFDVTIPGDQARRATTYVAWPQLSRILHNIRVTIYEGLCAQAFKTEVAVERRPSPQIIDELASLAVDTPWGLQALRSKAEETSSASTTLSSTDPAVQHARTLLNTWLSILRGAQPSKDEGIGPRFDPTAPFARLPAVRLDGNQKAELSKLTQEFAKWEAAAIGSLAGGAYVESIPGTTKGTNSPRYSLASTIDASTGVSRLTLVRTDIPSTTTTSTITATGTGSTGSSTSPKGVNRRTQPSTSIADMDIGEISKRLTDIRHQLHWRQDSFRGLPGSDSPTLSMMQQDNTARELRTTGTVDFGSIGRGTTSSASSTGQITGKPKIILDEQPIPDEVTSTKMERTSTSGPVWWDFDVVLKAFTDTTGHSVVGMFGLPATGNTLAAGAIVVDHFRKEADGRISLPQASSVTEIQQRLTDASNRKNGEDSATARLAGETLQTMNKVPTKVLERTRSIIAAAASQPLEECMKMEFRALARLFGLAPSSASLWDPIETVTSKTTKQKTSKTEKDKSIKNLHFTNRSAMRTHHEREQEQSQWERSLEAYLASGEGSGMFGDLFRRRYVYFKNPLGSQAFGETAHGILKEEAQAALKLGDRSAMAIAQDMVSTSPGSGTSSSRSGWSSRSRDQDMSDERVEGVAAQVAARRAIQYLGKGIIKVDENSSDETTTEGAQLTSIEETRFRSLAEGKSNIPTFLR